MLLYENFTQNKEKIIRLFGFALGDGRLQKVKNRIRLYYAGLLPNLILLKYDLRTLGLSSRINIDKMELWVFSRALPKLFYSWGMPIGRKPSQHMYIPDWMHNETLEIKRNFLAGLFGADGSKPIMRSYSPSEITYTITKHPSMEWSGIKFLKDIAELLKDFNIEVSDRIYKYKEKTGHITLRLYIKGEENIIRFLEKIGYAYDLKKMVLAQKVLSYYYLKKSYLLEKETIKKAIITLHEEGLGPKAITEFLSIFMEQNKVNKIKLHASLINKTLYKSRLRIRIQRKDGLMPFEEFLKFF